MKPMANIAIITSITLGLTSSIFASHSEGKFVSATIVKKSPKKKNLRTIPGKYPTNPKALPGDMFNINPKNPTDKVYPGYGYGQPTK